MAEIVKTIALLSCVGTGIILFLLLLKPWTTKNFPARWQYFVWLAVTVFMLFPVWKLVPARDAQKLIPYFAPQHTAQSTVSQNPAETPAAGTEGIQANTSPIKKINIYTLIFGVWLCGMLLFLVFAFGSYAVFLVRKKRNSIESEENQTIAALRQEMHIRRKIKIRISRDTASPMLVGFLFPVIYVPESFLDETAQHMIFRHELTHYKHKDLLGKWFSLLVNAVHWFNPFAYLLSANISESCEIACDMAVIRNLTEQEQKEYMNTILNLVQNKKRRENNV